MNITASQPLPTRLRTIVQRRSVLTRIVSGDLKVKYEGSSLGYVWSVLEPLLLTAVYFVVFTFFIGRFPEVQPYPLFLISGILPWQWFTATVSATLRSLRSNAKLITKVHVAREIFPLAAVGSRTIEFLLSLLVLVLFAAVYRHPPSVYLAAFPLAVILQLMLLTGIGLIVAPANTLLSDIERVTRPLLRALFYLTPILYPLVRVMESDLPYWAKVVYRLNPMVGILDLYRAAWFPGLYPDWTNVAISAVASLVVLVVGWWFFTRLEPAVLKEL